MIRITDKSKCCGCTACMNACPAQCIVMRRDREGFDYPVANPDRCIGCGKCEKVCPVLNPVEKIYAPDAYAVRNPSYLDGSSSGGVFPSFAEKVIGKGGVVYGAVMNDDKSVGHTDAESMEGVDRMRGSKYVQSDLYGLFEEVRYELEAGREVLFTGTPCQAAGLRSYLGKDYDGLLVMDCACHGVPSPGLWEKYVKALDDSCAGDLKSVIFRDKTRSWVHYDFVYRTGRQEVRKPYMKDPFMALFVQDMTLRPSCYSCPARKGRSGSDLTLADLWSVNKVAPGLNDDKGASLVMINTEKGRRAFDETGLQGLVVGMKDAVSNNGGFAETVIMPEKRTEFFQGYHSASDLIRYMKGFVVKRPLYLIIYGSLRSALSKIKRRIMK